MASIAQTLDAKLAPEELGATTDSCPNCNQRNCRDASARLFRGTGEYYDYDGDGYYDYDEYEYEYDFKASKDAPGLLVY